MFDAISVTAPVGTLSLASQPVRFL
jgi:hypothetical protein